MLSKTIFNNEQIPFTLTPEISPGVPAPLDGPITFDVVDGNSTVIPVEGNTDGTQVKLRSEDGIGVSHFKFKGDADLGAGFREVSLDVELIVIAPEAQTIGGTFGAAELKV